MSSQSDPDAPRLWYIGVVGVVLVFVTIVGLQAIFYSVEQKEKDRKAAQHGPGQVNRLRATQLEQLHDYRWIDRNNNIVAIPIERAMELVIAESNEQRKKAAGQ